MAAITGDIEVRALLFSLTALVEAATPLADVTPVPAPPEATSLPPPQEAKAMTEATQIVIFLRIGSITDFLLKESHYLYRNSQQSHCIDSAIVGIKER
jgi:hypothetical protein